MKTKLSLIASITLVILITGCGGSGSNSQTGTAFYKDSAVAGADYECGSKSGITDSNGKFEYEVGKDCIMKMAGVELRHINASELSDNTTIREDDPKVAAFLQSLDRDGNPDNGIDITDKEKEALHKIFEKEGIAKVPTSTKLSVVIAELHNEDSDYNGHEVDEGSAMAHVEKEKQKDRDRDNNKNDNSGNDSNNHKSDNNGNDSNRENNDNGN